MQNKDCIHLIYLTLNQEDHHSTDVSTDSGEEDDIHSVESFMSATSEQSQSDQSHLSESDDPDQLLKSASSESSDLLSASSTSHQDTPPP